MTDPPDTPPIDALLQRLRDGEYDDTPDADCDEVREAIGAYGHAEAEHRKELLRRLRSLAGEQPGAISPLVPALVPFLSDEERPVRLTTTKLFVRLAESDPGAVVDATDSLAERLADPEEFYFVRARAAEALGYAAVEHPGEMVTPDLLADLRVGLSFDEPEVREKLAKALECVALGNPRRLRHHVDSLAGHLDDEDELVRYHLCTALVAVGCEYPAKLADGRDALVDRLSDENEDPYVRGRAAEALGLLSRVDGECVSTPDTLDIDDEDAAEFVAPRVAFFRGTQEDTPDDEEQEVGTLASIRDGTGAVVEAMTTPDGEECPHCGLALPEGGPPMCPRCGAPH